jgi:hypothetical protein
MVLQFRPIAIIGLKCDHSLGELNQRWIVGAHQHQPLARTLLQDRMHALC